MSSSLRRDASCLTTSRAGWYRQKGRDWYATDDRDQSKARGGDARWFDDCPLVLYRLPQAIALVREGGTIYVVEGEKDADAINSLPGGGSVIATTNPGGSGKWRANHTEVLQGATVVIVADKDMPGRKHARQVGASLHGVVASVRVVEAREGKDAADHLAAGHGLEEFVPLKPEKPTATPAEVNGPTVRSELGNAERLRS